MRVTLVIPSITSGGAERVLAALANAWAERGDKVTLLTFDDGIETPFYSLSARINHVALNLLKNSEGRWQSIQQNFKRILALRSAIKASTPEVVISFLLRSNVRVLLATVGTGIPVIVSERDDPFHAKPGEIWQWLATITYPWATKITVHTRQAAQFFPLSWQPKIAVIANPVLIKFVVQVRLEGQKIIAIGRLEEQKAFDLLLRAFALIKDEFPEAGLTVWGEGTQRNTLELLCEKLGLQSCVKFPGVTKNIVEELNRANLFVQSSRWESFGNALCEAMATGLPVISTDCLGPHEIIRDNVDGLLVPTENVEALADAIRQIFTNRELRLRLASRAPEIIERFSLERTLNQWQEIVDEAIAQ